jgi:hypothetical protein
MLFEVCFCISLTCMLLLERIINAFYFLIVLRSVGSGSNLKSYASMQLVGSSVNLWVTLTSVVTRWASGVLSSVLSYIVWASIITFLFSLLYILQEMRPEILMNIVNFWNESVGITLLNILIIPMQIVNLFYKSVIPIYNAIVWISSKILFNVVIETIVRNMQHYVDFSVHFSLFVKEFVLSCTNYAYTLMNACPSPVSDSCYDVGGRVIDLITPMSQLQLIATDTSVLMRDFCANGAGLIDIAVYPLLDINLAKGLDLNIYFVMIFLMSFLCDFI